ncbi:MAG: HepT-like ribonuclease domain-containing protein [Prolixibacteraceae bacterium]
MLNKDYYILLSMLETIEKIIRYTSNYHTAEELYQNDRDFDAAMMNFIVIGEEVGKLTVDLKTTNKQINWEKIYSFRNIIAHHYFGINVDIVWQIITIDLPKLKVDLNLLLKQ